MDNLGDNMVTKNRWQRLLKGQQKRKVKTGQNVVKDAEDTIQRLHIMWVEICWSRQKKAITHELLDVLLK